ncbi:Hypothetical Protein XCAW_02243 [Xanthomonas citri subsp. citri Aw12879]|nr:Hypothetical Protein XCAW_02243 [Xanthomonas citri subsp. citri Aw12879]
MGADGALRTGMYEGYMPIPSSGRAAWRLRSSFVSHS